MKEQLTITPSDNDEAPIEVAIVEATGKSARMNLTIPEAVIVRAVLSAAIEAFIRTQDNR